VKEDTENPEDFAILFALDELQRRPGAAESRVPSEEGLAFAARLYVETMGLLPYSLDAVAPSASLRGRLLSALAGDETQPLMKASRAPAVAAPLPSGPVAVAPVARAARTATAPQVPSRSRRWPLALAATLAVAALGVAGWLFVQVEEQRATIVRLESTLRQEQARATTAQAAAELNAQSGAAASLALVTSPAVEVCALRPSQSGAAQPAARGALFVAADHQHWYLAVHGLRPAPAGQRYQVWFVVGTMAFSAGTFEARAGERVALSSETMPAGTEAVRITLEPEAGSSAPSGPEVLFGDEMFRT
jgi:Anti-sigma-K factor rskA